MVALLLPDWRSPKVNDTSAARSAGLRTRISSRILNPRGRSLSSSTASRRTRKKPLIRDVVEPAREEQPRGGGRGARRHGAPPPEPPGVPAVAVAAGHDYVDLAGVGLLEQLGDQLGGMLKVRVHHARPGALAARSPWSTAAPRPPFRRPAD